MEKENLSLFLKTCLKSGLQFDFEIFITLAYTGLRVGEFCLLKSSDVIKDDDGYFLSITKTMYNPRNIVNEYELVTSKNKTSRRVIDIDETVYNTLQRVIAFTRALKKVGQSYHDSDFIFVNTGKYPGYPLYKKFVQHRMNRILKLSGFDSDFTPHSFRHTHTSLLSEAEVSLERIMKHLGYGNDKITKKIYLHTTKPIREQD